MKRIYFLFVWLLSGFLSSAGGDPIHFKVVKPEAGQLVSFEYSALSGKLGGSKDIHAAIFYYTACRGSGYYAGECSLVATGKDIWKGSLTVPDSAVAFALRLKSGKIIEDNGGRGSIFPVYRNGAVVTGAYAGAGLLYGNGESLLGLQGKSDTALSLLEKEFSLHPELREGYAYSWYGILTAARKQEAYAVLDQKAQELLSSAALSEENYKLAIRLLQLQKKKKAADSMLAVAATRFPQSEMALQYAENEFYKIKDLDSQVVYYNVFRRTHPGSGVKDPAAETGFWMASSLCSRNIQAKNYRNAIGFAAQMGDIMADYRGYMYSWIALRLLDSAAALPLADSLVQAALAGVQQELAHPGQYKKQNITLSDWKADIEKYYLASFHDTYARILVLKGDLQKALVAQQESVNLSGGENNGFNEHYIKYLFLTGDVAHARQRSMEYIRDNKASDSVRIWFKELYVKDNGSDKGYDAFLAGLQSAGEKKFRAQALKEKLDLPSKKFLLKDLDGKEVSLGSLQGKVVIVDFWATWCGPCKASFPAMQATIEKYRKDTGVVFLFVDTWESLGDEERLSAVKKFIRENKYSFHVLLDNVVDLEKRQYSVVSDYGVTGIPTKFILGPKGNIVFKAVGFDGNNDKLISELSVYIELAKG